MDPWDDSHKRLDDRDRRAWELFVAALTGRETKGEKDTEWLAAWCFECADAFLGVRGEERRRGE